MKIMIIPMAAMAETHGPTSRCRLLANGFRDAGADVVTCMAEDVNYRAMEGITNYFLDIPMPLGLPGVIAKRTFTIAQKLGITSKKTVESFDQVLWFTGNLDHKYLKESVSSIRKAIRESYADAVYSEFNISAIIAAKKEGIPLYASVSYPTQHEYAHRKELAHGLNRILEELQLPHVDSALQLFDWADKTFCPSIRELEPIEKANVIYCGALKRSKEATDAGGERNKIVVYMGNGTIPADKMLKVIKSAFHGTAYEVYIASAYLKEEKQGNINVAPRWDFDGLLKESVLFINHGGQNSIADGLLNGVPQIVVPGKIFERKYNAKSIADNKAGVVLEQQEFNSDSMRTIAEEIIRSGEMAENALALGRKMMEAGGMNTIIQGCGI